MRKSALMKNKFQFSAFLYLLSLSRLHFSPSLPIITDPKIKWPFFHLTQKCSWQHFHNPNKLKMATVSTSNCFVTMDKLVIR